MKVSTCLVSDPKNLDSMNDLWNNFVYRFSENPFFLSEFVKQFMELNRSNGWIPSVLTIFSNRMIVGIAPFCTMKKLGVRFVKFLFLPNFSPDLVVLNQYRERCVAITLDFLFRVLQCKFADLTFQAESPNLGVLTQECEALRVNLWKSQGIGHYVLPVKRTWGDFIKVRGGKFRQEFRRVERRLNQAGSWRIVCVENGNKRLETIKNIFEVERRSWKALWRARRGKGIDPSLLMILKGSEAYGGTQLDFGWNVWFLELNNRPIAYALVLQYKGRAFVMKTSYDEKYRKFYPGKYLINAAIRDLFSLRTVEHIDFCTDLPVLRTWTSNHLHRVRVLLTQKGIVTSAIGQLFTQGQIRKAMRNLQDPLPIYSSSI